MSGGTWMRDPGRIHGLYRDRENGWIFGVCAGVAEFFGFRVHVVRLVAGVLLLLFFWLTVLVYVLATVLLRDKPLVYSGKAAESEFWRKRGGGTGWSHS